jgi:hypothetical protein
VLLDKPTELLGDAAATHKTTTPSRTLLTSNAIVGNQSVLSPGDLIV